MPEVLRVVVRWLVAALILVGGLGVIAVEHAPRGLWALPISIGPLDDDQAVWTIRRRGHEARLEVGTDGEREGIPLRAAADPDVDLVVGRYGLVTEGRSPDRVELVRARVASAEASWFRPPVALELRGVQVTAWQEAEEATLQAMLVCWMAAMLLAWPRWRPRPGSVRGWELGAACGLGALVPTLVWFHEVGGPWHANLHGFDRIAAVERSIPPAAAGLGLLHGHGWYVVVQGLYGLTAHTLAPMTLTAALAGALVVATWWWLRLLWDDPSAALLGALWLACLPLTVRLGGSVSMYVPAALAVVCSLALFETHLRTDRVAPFLLALPPAVLAAQTRAELAVVLPLWVGMSMLMRKPSWLSTAWRRPAVWLGLIGAVLLCVPRLVSLVRAPPPSDLRRWTVDIADDPRLWVLGFLVVVALALWRGGRRAWLVAGAVVIAGGAAIAVASWRQGGPMERTWQLHAVLDPERTQLAVASLPCLGAIAAGLMAPRRTGWLLLGWTCAVWLVLAQYDSLSTYVRTGLATAPLLAALVGGLALRAPRAVVAAAAVVCVAGAIWTPGQWVSKRYPTQQTWEAIEVLRAEVRVGDVVVWPAASDLPPELTREGFHTARLDLPSLMPRGVRTVGLDAWAETSPAPGGRTWMLVTPACWQPVLHPTERMAWTDRGRVSWAYLHVSDVVETPRIELDLPDGYAETLCARARASATVVVGQPLERTLSGSTYETAVPPSDDAAWVGVALLRPRPSP